MKRCHAASALALLAAVAIFTPPPALAQRITGDITGNVTDEQGAAVPGASVTAAKPRPIVCHPKLLT